MKSPFPGRKLLGNRNSKTAALNAEEIKARFTGLDRIHGREENLWLCRFDGDDGKWWVDLSEVYARCEEGRGLFKRVNKEIFGIDREPKIILSAA